MEWVAWFLEQLDARLREVQAEHEAECRGYRGSPRMRAEFQRYMREVKRVHAAARARGIPAEELELLGIAT